VIGNVALHKLNPLDVQRLLNEKRQNLSPRTVFSIKAVLSSALAQALKWAMVSRNVGALVDAPRIPRRQVVPFDAVQANRLLEAATSSRYEAVYELALKLGMRRGELLGLRWTDLDLDGRTLRVAQALQRVATGSDAKGKRSRPGDDRGKDRQLAPHNLASRQCCEDVEGAAGTAGSGTTCRGLGMAGPGAGVHQYDRTAD